MPFGAKNKKVSQLTRSASLASARSRRREVVAGSGKVRELLEIAENHGLLRGSRTTLVRGRMPDALVEKAKARTGINSDTKLLEAALANLAVGDEYPDWLISQRGKIPKDVDLGW